ncbi:MAG: glycerophosphodiester phosphodiesterase [Candidatus Limnocylindrales bacterium]
MNFTRPISFAHRGASAYAPENTLPAFKLALGQGATGLESDAWLAADAVVVLVHDPTIRLDEGTVDVIQSSSDELARWGVPSLAELYRACGTDYELSLDLEHPEVALPVLRVAQAAGAEGRLWACEENLEVLGELRAASPVIHLVCSTRVRRLAGGVAVHAERLAGLGIDALNMPWPDWTAERVAACHEHGIAAFGWDAQEPAVIAGLLGLNIDGLYSNYPDRLVRAIADRG